MKASQVPWFPMPVLPGKIFFLAVPEIGDDFLRALPSSLL